MVQDDLEKIWKRLRPFRLSPQRAVSATRVQIASSALSLACGFGRRSNAGGFVVEGHATLQARRRAAARHGLAYG